MIIDSIALAVVLVYGMISIIKRPKEWCWLGCILNAICITLMLIATKL